MDKRDLEEKTNKHDLMPDPKKNEKKNSKKGNNLKEQNPMENKKIHTEEKRKKE